MKNMHFSELKRGGVSNYPCQDLGAGPLSHGLRRASSPKGGAFRGCGA